MIRPECFVLVTEPNKADIANRANTTFLGVWQWQGQEGTKTSYSKGNFNQMLAKKKKITVREIKYGNMALRHFGKSILRNAQNSNRQGPEQPGAS